MMGDDVDGGAVSSATADGGGDEHLPIGEVLALLASEFPDVTISKIRFLESQGLIQPERTASGYRRFSTTDIERLQWILHQQRENFLPLKVIRKMLDAGVDHQDPPGASQQTLFASSVRDAAEAALAAEGDDDGCDPDGDPESDADDASTPSRPHRSPAHPAVASATPAESTPRRRPAPPGTPDGSGHDAVAAASSNRDGDPGGTAAEPPAQATSPARPRHETPADVVAALQEGPAPTSRRDDTAATSPPRRRPPTPPAPDDGARISAEELCGSAGIDADLLADLERFGLVRSESERVGERTYGSDAVHVARLAARYRELGVEPRHLRMYLVAAEREAGLVEQLAVPLLKQRNPRAREHASELATELAELGAELHRSILRRELGRDLLR